MKKIFLTFATLIALTTQVSATETRQRPYIQIVGSSTISPLMAAVSEEFSRNKSLKDFSITTPLVESTGTGAGFKLFCAGVDLKHPDFTNASRPIEENEIELCKKNGVKNIIEIKIGFDGIVFAKSIETKKIHLSKEQIFLALAEKIFDEKTQKLIANPYQTWNQIDAKLPKTKILIYGPPLTSGTRDVFVDMVMEEICFKDKNFINSLKDEALRKKQCHKIRNDGNFIELDENDNSIVQNLKNNHDAFGIIGFSFLEANKKSIQAMQINGFLPNQKNISSKKYPLSRPLFVYFKKEHLNLIPETREFILEIINPETIGAKGYLVRSGLVPLSPKELQEMRKNILSKLN